MKPKPSVEALPAAAARYRGSLEPTRALKPRGGCAVPSHPTPRSARQAPPPSHATAIRAGLCELHTRTGEPTKINRVFVHSHATKRAFSEVSRSHAAH